LREGGRRRLCGTHRVARPEVGRGYRKGPRGQEVLDTGDTRRPAADDTGGGGMRRMLEANELIDVDSKEAELSEAFV
jgi:hypothetical protein